MNVEEAVACLGRESAKIARSPGDAQAWGQRGACHYSLYAKNGHQAYLNAIRDYEQALKIAPKYFIILHNLAHIKYILGKESEAVELFSRALRLNNTWARTWFGRGLAHLALFQEQTAQRDFDQALRLDPSLMREFTQEIAKARVKRAEKLRATEFLYRWKHAPDLSGEVSSSSGGGCGELSGGAKRACEHGDLGAAERYKNNNQTTQDRERFGRREY